MGDPQQAGKNPVWYKAPEHGRDFTKTRDLFTDAEVTIGKHRYPVHRHLLCAESDYFRTAFTGKFKEAGGVVNLDGTDLSEKQVEWTLDFIYSNNFNFVIKHLSKPETVHTTLIQLFEAADYFCVEALKAEVGRAFDLYFTEKSNSIRQAYRLDDTEYHALFPFQKFFESAAAVFDSDSGHHLRTLRKHYLDFIVACNFELVRRERYRRLIQAIPELAAAVLGDMYDFANIKINMNYNYNQGFQDFRKRRTTPSA